MFGELLATDRVLVADGGMGTSLFEMGLVTGGSPELWNSENPEAVAAVHQSFVDVGADIILSNSFGGTASRLVMHDLVPRLTELNRTAVEIARGVADGVARPVAVAGSVGPTGSLFAPLGDLTQLEGVEIFGEQIRALVEGGCDLVWIETMYSFTELEAAVQAALPFGLPIVVTMSFDTHGHTMMGVAPSELADWWGHADSAVRAVGTNCGVGPADAVAAVAEISQTNPDLIIVAKANCGVPEILNGKLWYPSSRDDMSNYAALAIDAGARVVGGCCGSTPEHVRQIRDVSVTHRRVEIPDSARIESLLGPLSRRADVKRGRTRTRRRRSSV